MSDHYSTARFVIQEHHATNLHLDFRLEMDRVLKSWAVPKGVPTEKGIRRLAIQVEDHDLDYIDFEGTIAEGQYGAGKVTVWDSGNYELLARDKKNIEIILHGKRVSGKYVLLFWKEKNWLMFKKD